jgi:hypothetical protein
VKIVVTCGHPYSGFQLAYEALTQAGLARPQRSRRESISPTELHEKIFKANELDPSGLNVNIPINPGKVWQELAVDLFIGNMEQKNWGWADSRSVWLLDFWKELDPQVRFVLAYSTPEFALGKALSDGYATPGEIEPVLATWIAYHTEMLRFYNRNPDRSLLVNISATIHDPKTFIEKTMKMFGLDLVQLPPEHQVDIDSVSAIAATLAKALIEDDNEAYALYRELESAADIADPDALASNAQKRQALEKYTALLDRVDKANAEVSENAEYVNKLKDEQAKIVAELQSKIQQLTLKQNEYENLKQEHASLKRQLNDLQAKLKDAQAIVPDNQAGLAQENELLLLQLHQVQEELEHYFMQWQELSAKGKGSINGMTTFINNFWSKHQPSEVVIDFRDEIEGDNWYYAELDGRWAGPGSVSTVKLPSLRKGQYEFYLDIVDAMAPEIITGMEISLNGTGLQTTVDGEGYPAMVCSEFTVENAAQHPLWEFQFRFPMLISPAQHGSDDNRHLAIRVRSLKLRVTA